MEDEPVSWNFGLMAERWAECMTEAPELPFWEQEIARYGQPVLDVACGIGRLLIPLLSAGIDVDGCDISGDILKQCRRKALAQGFHPGLFEQPMHSLELPRRYRTIYICNAFGLGASLERDLEALRRCHAHLEDGGALLLNIQGGYTNPEEWNLWLKENREALPQPWPEKGAAQVASDGSQYYIQVRTVHFDPLEQVFTRQIHVEKWFEGRLTASGDYTIRGTVYFKNEILLMLRSAGFRQVSVRGDFTDQAATAEAKELVFTAVRNDS
jgi:SAM-dependent methyltransferase